MGTIIKFVIAIAIVWFGYALILDNQAVLKDEYEDVKQDVIEYVNPVAKEERLLGDLNEQLASLEEYVQKLPEGEILGAQTVLKDTRAIVTEIDEINDKKTSTISAQVNKVEELIKKFPGSDSDVASFTYTDEDGTAYACTAE